MNSFLSANGEWLRTFETVPDLYLILSPDLIILTASNAYLEATLQQRTDLVGRHVFDVFPDNPHNARAQGKRNLEASFQKVLSTGRPHRMPIQQYDLLRPGYLGGGFEKRYWSPLNTPVLDKDGTIQYLIHKVEDVTELLRMEVLEQTNEQLQETNQALKQRIEQNGQQLSASEEELHRSLEQFAALNRLLSQREAFLSSLINQTSVGIVQTDYAGRFTFANESYCRLVGYTLEELREKSILDITHPNDCSRNQALLEQLLRDGRWFEIEKRYVRGDGSIVWVLNNVSLVERANDELPGIMSISQDITRRKQAEEALARALSEKDRINQQLMTANTELDSFVYMASHDLKSPLSNMEGLMKVLTRQLEQKGWQDPGTVKVLDMIQVSMQRFRRTLNDMTDFAKVQKQTDEAATLVSLSEVLQDVVHDLHEQIDQMRAIVESQLDHCPLIPFSRKNLKSILFNLLSNALKYHHPDRRPEIVIDCLRKEDQVILSVQDNGLGMDTSDVNKVFGAFKRLHNHVEGSGVGLYIVKKLMENGGGEIRVESTINEGSTFRLFFRQ